MWCDSFDRGRKLKSLNVINAVDVYSKELFFDEFIDERIFWLLVFGTSALSHVSFDLLDQNLWNRVRIFVQLQIMAVAIETVPDQLDYLLVGEVVQHLLLVICLQLSNHVRHVLVFLFCCLSADQLHFSFKDRGDSTGLYFSVERVEYLSEFLWLMGAGFFLELYLDLVLIQVHHQFVLLVLG